MRLRGVIRGSLLLGIGVATGYWIGSRVRDAEVTAHVAAGTVSNSPPAAPLAGAEIEPSQPSIRTAVQTSEPGTKSENTRPTSPRVVRAADLQGPTSQELANSWRSDIRQIQDPGARARALAELREALAGTDRTRLLAALGTLRVIMSVDYDKSAIHSSVEGLLQSTDPEIKRAAIGAFCATGGPQPDAHPLLALTSDPDPAIRTEVARSILSLTRETTDSSVEGVFAKLLEDKDPAIVSATLQSLRQIETTEAVEDRLLDLAKDPALAAEVCRSFAMKPAKSDRVVDLLLRQATSSDGNSIGDAVRGLSNGLNQDQRERAADELVRSLGSASDLSARWACFQFIESWGSQRHISTLQSLASNPMLDERSRSYIARVIAELEKKKDG